MVILDLHHMGQLLRLVTSITTTPRLITVVTLGGKSVEEPTLELVRITDCGPDLFLDAQVSIRSYLFQIKMARKMQHLLYKITSNMKT